MKLASDIVDAHDAAADAAAEAAADAAATTVAPAEPPSAGVTPDVADAAVASKTDAGEEGELVPIYSKKVVTENTGSVAFETERAKEALVTKLRHQRLSANVKELIQQVKDRKQSLEQLRAEFTEIVTQHEEATKKAAECELDTLTQAMHQAEDKLIAERVTAALDQYREELGDQVESRFQIRLTEMMETMETSLQNKVAELELHVATESERRMEIVKELNAKIAAFEALFEEQSRFTQMSNKVHQLAKAVSELRSSVIKEKPFGSEWIVLHRLALDDELMGHALSAIPMSVVREGVPSNNYLSRRFQKVERACLRSLYTPGGKDPSLYGVMLAELFTFLTVQEHVLVHGSEDHKRLSRAGYYMDNGNIKECYHEMSQLTPQLQKVCHTWLAEATDRLVTEQALAMMQAHIKSLQVSYAHH